MVLKVIRILQCCFLLRKTQARTVPWKRGTSSSTYLQDAEEAELGSSQRQLHGKFLFMWLRSFHLVWWEWILYGKVQNYCWVKSLSSKIPQPRYSRETLLLSPYILTFIYTLAHTSDTKYPTGNASLLTLMKSFHTNWTTLEGREKCSTPHCKKAQARCSPLLRYRCPALCAASFISLWAFPYWKRQKKRMEINSEWQL